MVASRSLSRLLAGTFGVADIDSADMCVLRPLTTVNGVSIVNIVH
jgi:hypothetical protein